jgi:hypothetical protein
MNSTNNQIVNQINIIIGKYVKNYTNKISKKYNIEKKELSDMWNEIITEQKVEDEIITEEKFEDEIITEEKDEIIAEEKFEDEIITEEKVEDEIITEELEKTSDEELEKQVKKTRKKKQTSDEELEKPVKKTRKKKQTSEEELEKTSDEELEKPVKKTRKKKQTSDEDLENIWKVQKQLGESGKEGTCYLVINKSNEEYAMKQFKTRKSKVKFDKEVSFQRRACELGLAPKVIDVMYDPPRIVMECMNRTIEQVIKDQNGILTEDQQNDIISLCQKLDENNIYHCDPNPLNLMEGFDGKFKWIDYGMSIDINVKKHTNNPNVKALTSVFYGGLQGLITKQIICEDNILIINEKIINEKIK